MKAPQSLVEAIRRQTVGNTDLHPKSDTVQQSTSLPDSFLKTSPPAIQKSSLKNTLMETFFVDPNSNNKTHFYFASFLAISVLAMLVFAGFMHERETALIDGSNHLIQPNSNIFEMTNTVFAKVSDGGDLASSDLQVISNQVSKVLGKHATIPQIKDFTVSYVRTAAFGKANGSEIVFQHNRSPQTVVAVFILQESDLHKENCITNDVMNFISENGRNLYQTTCPNSNNVVLWKWGEMIYTATTNSKDVDLKKAVRNPHWEDAASL
jgi:hypothetical protein